MNTPLRRARERAGKTIAEVATAVGCDAGNLSRIERAEQVPSRELAERLAKYFDMDELRVLYPERYAAA